MRRALTQILNSRVWIVLSIICSIFALYEGIEKIIAGEEIEGLLDLLVMVVITVNLVNKFKMLTMYVGKLKH